MVFKLRILITYQSRGAKHKATIGSSLHPDQVVELEASAPCKSDLARRGYYQLAVEANLMALVLPNDARPIACLSYLPGCIVGTVG